MAAFQDKMLVNSAITESTKMDLSCDYITTGQFFELMPVYIKEMVPGEHIKIQSEEFTRLQPLNVPTFGRGNINTRGFFVPMRTIMKQWNEFITDAPTVTGELSSSAEPTMVVPTSVPSVHAEKITEAFLRQCGVTGFPTILTDDLWGQATTTIPNVYDLAISVQGTLYYITLNAQGRRVKKTLESLGYKVYPRKTTSAGTTPTQSVEPGNWWSMMPMLALAKIYVDWYINSAYGILYEDALYIQRMLNNMNPASYDITVNSLVRLLNFIVIANYDSDYFVSAWDNPVSPNPTAFTSNIVLNDVSFAANNNQAYESVVTNDAGSTSSYGNLYKTPVIRSTGSNGQVGSNTSVNLSQYVLTALKSLTDYMKRHQMVGVHAFDRYLSRFGKGLSDEQLQRSKYLGAHKGSIQFGDVMSTAGVEPGKGLGSFAGKGMSYDKGSFEYSTNEYGYVILVSSIIPSVGYYQGIDRNILHTNKLDFWTPEFDNLGVQTINSNELYIPTDGSHSTAYSFAYTFGFTPRYSEYKVSRDRLTGDFTVNSINPGMDEWGNGALDAWHFFRKFDDNSFGVNAANIVHSKDFVSGAIDGEQYNRIFQTWNAKQPQDMFWMIWHFDVISHSPMKSMYDVYEFEDKGRKIVEEVNGVKMN